MDTDCLLAESERLIFCSAVSISESDYLIERSRPLFCKKGEGKTMSEVGGVSTVSDRTLTPSDIGLHADPSADSLS
jgi:hypothetical protein